MIAVPSVPGSKTWHVYVPSRFSGYSDIVSDETDEQVDLETDLVIGGVGSGLTDLMGGDRETGVIADDGGVPFMFPLLLLLL